jgi:hypothetical protein
MTKNVKIYRRIINKGMDQDSDSVMPDPKHYPMVMYFPDRRIDEYLIIGAG